MGGQQDCKAASFGFGHILLRHSLQARYIKSSCPSKTKTIKMTRHGYA